ncbi:hypothetical protein PSR1_04290 [Anaeromyxobacter sp. PSR-1]|nr:hypothetical protein PSR1_04290 [Anaeromyxobacter sp. PSR-1]
MRVTSAAKSSMLAKRPSGCFASARSTSASTSGGIPARRRDGGSGACVWCATSVAMAVSPTIGSAPVSIS